jgi:hypothetical protein
MVDVGNKIVQPDARVGANNAEERLTLCVNCAHVGVEIWTRVKRGVANGAHGGALGGDCAVGGVDVGREFVGRPKEVTAVGAGVGRRPRVDLSDVGGHVAEILHAAHSARRGRRGGRSVPRVIELAGTHGCAGLCKAVALAHRRNCAFHWSRTAEIGAGGDKNDATIGSFDTKLRWARRRRGALHERCKQRCNVRF